MAQPPIMNQPKMNAFYPNAPPPQASTNVPFGLDYLTMIDQVLIKQQVELFEVFTGFETNNKYEIKNSMGQQIFFAAEENDCCTRNCLKSSRPFDIVVMDNMRHTVMNIHRPFRCSSCCFFCCLQELVVEDANQNVLGSITQDWSIFVPKYSVRDKFGNKVLSIEGPFCQCSICGDVDFDVFTKDKSQKVGKITKQWSGLAREMFTDADYFGVTFPLDLDVNIKATLLAATFLIDFMFFEDNQNNQNN